MSGVIRAWGVISHQSQLSLFWICDDVIKTRMRYIQIMLTESKGVINLLCCLKYIIFASLKKLLMAWGGKIWVSHFIILASIVLLDVFCLFWGGKV